MTGVDMVELPKGDYLTVISRGKEFHATKVARAVVAGQIKIEDIKGLENERENSRDQKRDCRQDCNLANYGRDCNNNEIDND